MEKGNIIVLVKEKTSSYERKEEKIRMDLGRVI